MYKRQYIDLVDKEWANPDSVNENNTFVYASTTSENKNWEAPLIYHPIEKTWYKAGPKSTQKTMKFANLSWSELSAMMSNDNWEAIKLN